MRKYKFYPKSLEIEMSQKLLKILFSYRQNRENDIEKGGVLMGELYPNSNRIKLTHILLCKNSNSNRYNLELNVKHLQKEMDKIWKQSNGSVTYLGDWHTHPEVRPKPSYVDYKTFLNNYYSSNFNQNLLLYIILGTKSNMWIKSFNGFLFKSHNFKNN